MSALGTNRTFEGVLNKSLEVAVHRLNNKYYCPVCYGMELIWREVESGVFDISCLTCHTHWTKTRINAKNVPKRQKNT